MNLHLTINGRWVDAVSFHPNERQNKAYLESLKQSLKERWKILLEETKAATEFYLDPLGESNLPDGEPV